MAALTAFGVAAWVSSSRSVALLSCTMPFCVVVASGTLLVFASTQALRALFQITSICADDRISPPVSAVLVLLYTGAAGNPFGENVDAPVLAPEARKVSRIPSVREVTGGIKSAA